MNDIQKKQLIWYDHIKKGNDNNLPKIMFNSRTNQKENEEDSKGVGLIVPKKQHLKELLHQLFILILHVFTI